MKKTNITLILLLALILFLSLNSVVQGQPPYPPGGHGSNGNQGGTAPLDGGSLLLILYGLGYGALKLVRVIYRKKDDA